ncbi:hypothetical protein [Streptomyces sp. RKND-216]|uniref:hypothetical protein n=1 Tax=Streptomyces sp. RKND-216 TaxID=2562581 RepID=UPI001445048D|nr:hypothetical protein [Streptomyces sp. RKND-216]
MLDATPLTDEVDLLADRLRAMPQSALLRGAAAEAHGLAAELARRAQLLEFPGRDPRPLPEAGPFAAGDQLSVAGHDLAVALADSGTREQLTEVLRLVTEVGAKL